MVVSPCSMDLTGPGIFHERGKTLLMASKIESRLLLAVESIVRSDDACDCAGDVPVSV